MWRRVLVVVVVLFAGCSDPQSVVAGGPPPESVAPTAVPPVPTAVPATVAPAPTEIPTEILISESDAGPLFQFAVARQRPDGSQIPVYDLPGGAKRTLVDVNAIDRSAQPNPLFSESFFGQPLVLRVMETQPEWVRVQVPTRPNNSHVWLRAEDVELRSTNVWVEASTASSATSQAGNIWVYVKGEQVFQAPVSSGREGRETPLGTGWVVEAVAGGDCCGPAYGSWVVSFGRFSEALGTFGANGSAPLMVAHGTNQPETVGLRVSSGALRMTDEDLDLLAAIEGIIGAPVHIHSGPQLGPTGWRELQGTASAVTQQWAPDAEAIAQVPI